jgi:probable rRNA maturation factor
MLFLSLTKQVRRHYQPKRREIIYWLKKALVKKYRNISIDCVIVTSEMSMQYNQQYRGRSYPTNIISLEYGLTRNQYAILCGELIFCDENIVSEALAQGKLILAHYAHLLVHGMLHLQGFDHIVSSDTLIMEQLETQIMQDIGFDNPYAEFQS